MTDEIVQLFPRDIRGYVAGVMDALELLPEDADRVLEVKFLIDRLGEKRRKMIVRFPQPKVQIDILEAHMKALRILRDYLIDGKGA